MFGYVRPNKPELLIREFDVYKAVYCTLCKELGKRYGFAPRMALNYDLTFYTLLALDLDGAKPQVRKGRCVVNPIKKCNFICEGAAAYHKGAALTVLMTGHKIRDNIADEGFFKSLLYRMALPFFSGAMKKAAGDFPFMAQAIEEMMAAQSQLEGRGEKSVDACCEPTAKALESILQELGQADESRRRPLAQLGYFLGRWIYLMDAADDLSQDLQHRSFNPLIHKLALSEQTLLTENRGEIDTQCNEMLNHNVSMMIAAGNLLELGRYGSIIENILHKGLGEIQREILFLHIHEKKPKKKD